MRARTAVVAGAALVAAAAIIEAVTIHPPISLCSSYVHGHATAWHRCGPHDYSLGLRLGIAAFGLLAAALIITMCRPFRHRL
jgi:hypothetical protein